jgi:hypothetical protein
LLQKRKLVKSESSEIFLELCVINCRKYREEQESALRKYEETAKRDRKVLWEKLCNPTVSLIVCIYNFSQKVTKRKRDDDVEIVQERREDIVEEMDISGADHITVRQSVLPRLLRVKEELQDLDQLGLEPDIRSIVPVELQEKPQVEEPTVESELKKRSSIKLLQSTSNESKKPMYPGKRQHLRNFICQILNVIIPL